MNILEISHFAIKYSLNKFRILNFFNKNLKTIFKCRLIRYYKLEHFVIGKTNLKIIIKRQTNYFFAVFALCGNLKKWIKHHEFWTHSNIFSIFIRFAYIWCEIIDGILNLEENIRIANMLSWNLFKARK